MAPEVPVGLLARLFQPSAEMWRAVSEIAKDDQATRNLIKIIRVWQIPVYFLIAAAVVVCLVTGLR